MSAPLKIELPFSANDGKDNARLCCGFILQYVALAFLFSVFYGGEMPYDDMQGPANPNLSPVQQSVLFMTADGVQPDGTSNINKRSTHWENSAWSNSFYVAGRNDGAVLKFGKMLSIVFWPATGIWHDTAGWDVATAGKSLIYETEDNSFRFGRKNHTFANKRPAYGKLQAFAQQFVHIEELAERQAGVACGQARPYTVNATANSTGVHSTIAGQEYCKFLDARATNVRLWFRTVANTWHMAVFALTLLLFVYATRFVAGVLLGYLAQRWDRGASQQVEASVEPAAAKFKRAVIYTHKAYILVSHTAEALFCENLLLWALLLSALMVKFMLSDAIVLAIADGPDTMGHLAETESRVQFLREPVAPYNFYDHAPGLQRGRVLFSSEIFSEAQRTANWAVVAWLCVFVTRASFYYNKTTFFNATPDQADGMLVEVFGFLKPGDYKSQEDKSLPTASEANLQGHESNNTPCPMGVCFWCCCAVDQLVNACCSDLRASTSHALTLWWLRGRARYAIFVFFTFAWIFLICLLYAPVFYFDGLRSDLLGFWAYPAFSAKCALSLFGSMPEQGGYGLAAVLGVPAHGDRYLFSPRRQAYQDFTVAANKNAEEHDAVSMGMTYGMFAPMDEQGFLTDDVISDLDAKGCSMCLDFSGSTNLHRLTFGGGATNSSAARAAMQINAPDILGYSALLRYNAVNAEAVVHESLRYTVFGAWIVLSTLLFIFLLRGPLTPTDTSSTKGAEWRAPVFALMQLAEFAGQALILVGALLVCFFAVPHAEAVRDSLATMGSSGIGLRQQGVSVADKLGAQYTLAHGGTGADIGNRMNKFVSCNANSESKAFCKLCDGSGQCNFENTDASYELAGGTPGTATFDKPTGATTYQRAVGVALSSSACSVGPAFADEFLPHADCELGKRSYFRDQAFLFPGANPMDFTSVRSMRCIVDANLRPTARSETSYFFDSGTENTPSSRVYGVNDDAIVTPGFENDMRMVTIFVILFCALHVIMFEMLFVPMYSDNKPRKQADDLRKDYSPPESVRTSGPVTEMRPLLATQYQPTQLRMTGMPSKRQ